MRNGLFVLLAVTVAAALSGCCCGSGGGCCGLCSGWPGSGYADYAACNTPTQVPCETCGPATCQTCARPDVGLGGDPAYRTVNPGPPTAAITYPYYTTRGPRDFLAQNPPSIGP
jgi:hypothetical protein